MCILRNHCPANPTPIRLFLWVWWMRIPHSRGNGISFHGPAIPGPLRGHLTPACLICSQEFCVCELSFFKYFFCLWLRWSIFESFKCAWITQQTCSMPGKLSYFSSIPTVQFVSYLHYISRTGTHGKHHRPDHNTHMCQFRTFFLDNSWRAHGLWGVVQVLESLPLQNGRKKVERLRGAHPPPIMVDVAFPPNVLDI